MELQQDLVPCYSPRCTLKSFVLLLCLSCIFVGSNGFALNVEEKPVDYLVRFKLLYFSGHQEAAFHEVSHYLNENPSDGDVQFLLGQWYYQDKDYRQSQRVLLKVLEQSPTDSDASLLLINTDLALGQQQEALTVVNLALIFNPIDQDLLKKKRDIEGALRPQKTITSSQSKTVKPRHKLANITPKPPQQHYVNEVGTYQQNYYISDKNKVWDYSSIYYGRETSIGKIYGKINYANRLDHEAIQGEIEAYPRINQYLYLDLDVAFANEPNLFPDTMYGAEAYVTTQGVFDFSLGAKNNLVDENHQFAVFTGSLSKVVDHGQNLILFRPYYFMPGHGSNSALYTLNVRHSITDPYFYFGCLIGAGSSPDLANLTTINFIVLRNKIINPYINFPLFNERLIVNLSGLFQNQLFPGTRVRNWSGGTLGAFWRF